MKLSAVSAKTWKTLKYLLKTFFNMGIMNLYLLPCFRIFFKKSITRVIKVLVSEVNFKL